MDYVKVIAKLKRDYPGKKIIRLPEEEPTEVLCEVEPTEDHPELSVAISVIDKSVPHFHNKVTETYEVLRGTLMVYVDGVRHKLEEGDKLVVKPGLKHYAVGDETWIKCTATPGWVVEDHIMEGTKKARE